MKSFEKVHPVAVMAAAVMAVPAAAIAQPETAAIEIVSLRSGEASTLAAFRGGLTALHFLAGDPEADGRMIAEILKHAPGAAGVRHVFITPPRYAGDALLAAAPARAELFSDSAGDLARSLDAHGPGPAHHTVILLETDGARLGRIDHAGEPVDRWFAGFVAEVSRLSRPESIAHYNLPRAEPLAVEGYDIVAYFTEGRAVRGRAEHESRYRGVIYRFASEERWRQFALDPEGYLPTYGGWCASAMADGGRKVEIDPTNFKVKGGRLFLFYKSVFANALKDWNRREREWEPAADEHWQKISGEASRPPLVHAQSPASRTTEGAEEQKGGRR